MALNSSPIIRRQRLGAELRQIRKGLGLTGEQVADRLGWAAYSKLSRIELAQSRPNLADILDLLDVYEVVGAKREELIAVARDAASSGGWWRAFADTGARQRGYIELETGAAEIFEYQQFLIPGLLQTPEYARIRMHAGRDLYGELDPEADTRARTTRQKVLTRDKAPMYEAIIDEAALRRNASPTDVAKAQFEYLVERSRLPNVTIRVLPFKAQVGEYYVAHSAFMLYRFHDPADPETVVLETLTSDVHLRDDEDLALFRRVYGWLRAAALPAEESIGFITGLASQL